MRRLLLALLLLTPLLPGGSCLPAANDLRIVQPADGIEVGGPAVAVAVELAPDVFEPGSLEATLNGEPVPLVAQTPGLFTAELAPGPPLALDNLLVVRARPVGSFAWQRAERVFTYAPARTVARRITDASDLITGPLAHGRVGDWLLENGAARFVIQDAPARDQQSIGQFGGNLIDAALVGRPGLDSWNEIQPSVNIETVLNAQSVEIVHAGGDGQPAVVRSCGPDDLIDWINPSSQVSQAGFPVTLPAGVDDLDLPVEGCTEYTLGPGLRWLEVTTTLTNLSGEELGLYVGDLMNGAGELEHWSPPAGPGALDTGVGEMLVTFGDAFVDQFGFGAARGVDYTYLGAKPPETPGVSGSASIVGFSFVLHGNTLAALILGTPPHFFVPPGGSNAYTRHFGVGGGDGADAVDMQIEVEGLAAGALSGCVTVGGEPAPEARVIAVARAQDDSIQSVRSIWFTDPDGCYAGRLPVGSYAVAAERAGAPYEGGGPVPVFHPVEIVPGGDAVQDVALPGSGRLRVRVADANDQPLPARVSVVGRDPSPPLFLTADLLGFIEFQSGLFRDARDVIPYGLVAFEYTGADGLAELDVEPGSYRVFVSRGTEYSLHAADVEITAGDTAQLEATLARVLDTPGFVSSDFHVHMIQSLDSRVTLEDRARQFAGEGVENVVATDHQFRTDLSPAIAARGLEPWLNTTVGEEITTADTGHFNAYPLGIDPTRVTGGSVDWGRPAPPGEDFPSLGHFVLTPGEILAQVENDPINSPEVVVQINHIDSHFAPLEIDTALVPPRSSLDAAEALAGRLDPTVDDFFTHFPALELWNGSSRGAQAAFLEERAGIWMNHLNQGLLTTAIADTDTHTYDNLASAGARTWSAAPSDAPTSIDDDAIGAAVRAGRAVGGQGLYVQTRLLAASTGQSADLTLGGSTLASTTDGEVTLHVDVQAPTWAAYDTIDVYVNAETVATGSERGTPVLYAGTPTLTLLRGVDFAVDTVVVDPDVPGAERLETHLEHPLALDVDAWVAVVVRGTDGTSPPMFPVYPASLDAAANPDLASLLDGNLGEGGTLALGFTNALYVDTDGNGVFDPPWLP